MKFQCLLFFLLASALITESQIQTRGPRGQNLSLLNNRHGSVVKTQLPLHPLIYPIEEDSYLQASNFAQNEKNKTYVDLQPPAQEQRNENYRNERNNNDQQISFRNSQSAHNNIISDVVTNFGLGMLKNINQPSRNVVISPISVSMLLALLQQGALGVTQQQISTALQMSPDVAAIAFKSIINNIQKRNSRNILSIANNIYVADGFDLSPAFKRTAIQNFGSEVTPIKFERSEKAVSQINRWVAAKTNDKIPEILRPDELGDYTQLVLVNAVYFKGLWQMKFNPQSTISEVFYLKSGAPKTVPFMRMRGIFRTGVDRANNAEILILPFENNQYSILMVLPAQVFGLDSLISSMTVAQLAEYNKVLPKEVHLEIPKFTVRGDLDLKPILRSLGATDLFNQQSNLSGVGVFRTSSPQVSSSLHTAMLSIDENGGSAAAATAFVAVALSYDDPAIFFKANRPFLAVLWDNQLELPIIMAKIEDPSS